ncbi:MAG TPA: BamA/TamA family outer membrane protein [Vicinamibacterales bacterium]|nr:BamA/TamA family outer membrane protein [Vicinamibacterales bacterium]
MTIRLSCVSIALGLMLTAGAARSEAQQSREEDLAQAQADKAKKLHPYEPNTAERVIAKAGRALMGPPTGFYPWLGTVYSGGLFAVGPGYRYPFGGGGVLDAQAAVSLRGYTLLRTTMLAPPLANERVRMAFFGEVIDAKKVGFYGIGNETVETSRVTYRYEPRTAGARLTFTPVKPVEFGAAASYIDITINESGPAPNYLLTEAHAAFDWRDTPGYSRRGGYYRVDWSNYDDQNGGLLSFRQVQGDVRQLIPILRANWVIALRATTSLTYTSGDSQVPFFLMPYLGGGSTLRGYRSRRFRDRNRLLFTAEYRWTPSHFADMAVFHDMGKVAATSAELNLSDLHHATGIGIRFHTPAATFFRVEAARGTEGLKLIFAFSPIG